MAAWRTGAPARRSSRSESTISNTNGTGPRDVVREKADTIPVDPAGLAAHTTLDLPRSEDDPDGPVGWNAESYADAAADAPPPR